MIAMQVHTVVKKVQVRSVKLMSKKRKRSKILLEVCWKGFAVKNAACGNNVSTFLKIKLTCRWVSFDQQNFL